MWQRITNPDVLIYLDATLATIRSRRQDPDFPSWLLDQENERLRHARQHCGLYIDTDSLTRREVLVCVLEWLEARIQAGFFDRP
jgi:hypothetical protein